MFKNICLIGAGNIGSRHLQALAKVKTPLSIYVIDPNRNSLKLAEERFREIEQANPKTQLKLLTGFSGLPDFLDIAIIATTSDIRSKITEDLLSKIAVNFIIFEKLLFNKKNDYEKIGKLLEEKKSKAWVNCSMRTDPFYSVLKQHFKDQKITYIVYGSQHGLITNAIHYIDHISYLTDCYDFRVDTNYLDKTPSESKRKGFLEINGTLNIHFKDGSFGSFICYPSGNAPFFIEILSEKYHCIIRALDNKSLISSADTDWEWQIKTTPLLYQSQMTSLVVSSILKFGTCDLPTFDVSAKMHLSFLDPILKFLNIHSSKKFNFYPFT